MRRYQKKQLLELIEYLHKSNEIISSYINEVSAEEAISFLTECQQNAIRIGNIIEEQAKNVTPAVQYLEEYCEVIYKISISLKKINSRYLKKIHFLMCQIENIVRNDIVTDKLEIVFLPYKAAMWDSLESIWASSVEDEDCNSYVVPIPYYDKNTDHSLGQEHYEGNDLPDYVPITSWESYNIKERHPDIVFIHNPYDNGNLVTSVHPVFYAKELKKYSDKLIYVPYFVCFDDIPEYMCINSATIFADTIIVQSEVIKKSYIKSILKYVKENDCEELFGNLGDKIKALGSPKFDKVINTKKEDLVIPIEWENLIEKTAKEQRKIVLYNTNVAGLLNGNEKSIDKLQSVLDLFRYRRDVLLLWRPHPLNTAACSSMRPKLLKEYLHIINNYRSEGWGIYDDTPDLHRAIALSDAYYGDSGSLIALYAVTGKEIMIQNTDYSSNSAILSRNISFENMYIEGNDAWITGTDIKAIFKMSLISYEIDYISYIPNSKDWTIREYCGIIKNGDLVILVPRDSNSGWIYQLNNHEFIELYIKPCDEDFDYMCDKFVEAVRYENYVYFIPGRYPAIIRFNLQTNETEYFTDWYDEISVLISDKKRSIFVHGNCICGSHLFLAFWQGNRIIDFDMKNGEYKIYKIGNDEYCFSCIAFDGEDYWIASRNVKAIIKWNKATGKIKEYNNFPDNLHMKNNLGFMYIECFESGILAFPLKGNMIVEMSSSTNIFKELIPLETEYKSENGEQPVLSDNFLLVRKYSENRFICYAVNEKCIMDIDMKNHRIMKIDSKLSEKYSDEEIRYLMTFANRNYVSEDINDNIFHENSDYTLSNYLRYITSAHEDNTVKRKELFFHKLLDNNEQCGKRIYENAIQ